MIANSPQFSDKMQKETLSSKSPIQAAYLLLHMYNYIDSLGNA